MTNTNPYIKKILRALPQDPEPSTTQMVTACTRATSMEQTAAAAVSKGVREAVVTLNNIHCFNCKQYDHVYANCPYALSDGRIDCHMPTSFAVSARMPTSFVPHPPRFQQPPRHPGNGVFLAPHNDTEWQTAAVPGGQRKPIPRRVSDTPSPKGGFRYFCQTGQLDLSLCRVLRSHKLFTI